MRRKERRQRPPGEATALGVARFVLGAFLAGFVYLCVVGGMSRWERWEVWLLVAFLLSGGLAGLFIGDRFFGWIGRLIEKGW